MAFTVTDRGSNEADYVSSMDAGDTFTAVEDDIIVIAVSANIGTSFTSVTGWGATWSEILIISNLHIWAARIGASPGSDEATINFSGTASASAITVQIAGVSTSGSVSSVFIQNQTVSQYNATSPLAIPTLAAFASATNLSLSFAGASVNNNFTPQSGWTQAAQASDAFNNFNVAGFFKTSEDTTQTVEGTLFGYNTMKGVGFEVAEEVVAGGDLLLTNRSIANYQGMRQ